MNYKQAVVPIDRINIDDTYFKISTGDAPTNLVESIRQIGLINPPVVIEYSGSLRIVSGFKRVAACLLTGADQIAIRLLAPQANLSECIQIAIVDNTSQRSLNLIEQAHAISLLSSVCADESQMMESAKLAGLSVNPDLIKKLIRLSGIAPFLKEGVLDESIALPVALQLHEMGDVNATQALGMLFRELGLSLNRQREMLGWISSICRRDDVTPAQLIAAAEINEFRQNDDLDRRQKIQFIREYLKHRRFPTIVQYEKRFSDIVDSLELHRGIYLIPPQNFESPTYSFKIEFNNTQELRKKIKELDNIAKTEKIEILWDDDCA